MEGVGAVTKILWKGTDSSKTKTVLCRRNRELIDPMGMLSSHSSLKSDITQMRRGNCRACKACGMDGEELELVFLDGLCEYQVEVLTTGCYSFGRLVLRTEQVILEGCFM